MAIGIALLFNIRLPLNFNSPYKATSIQDFWKRWHITLSRWLRDYIYIPLGGNRVGNARLYINLMITFILGGLWHGAGWTFLLWGLLHGAALCLERIWKKLGVRLPFIVSWGLTFLFVHIAWVLFRAEDIPSALSVLKAMVGGGFAYSVEGLSLEGVYNTWGEVAGAGNFIFICLFGLVAFIARNSVELALDRKNFNVGHTLIVASAVIACILMGISSKAPEFLYFNF
jgi:hypothetical protein